MPLIRKQLYLELEPNNEDVESKINIQVEDDCIRLFLHDCHESICWRFYKGVKGWQKLERVKVMIEMLEREFTNYAPTDKTNGKAS